MHKEEPQISPEETQEKESEKKETLSNEEITLIGIYKMVSLAHLEQSMSLMEGYIKNEAVNAGNNVYNIKLEEYKKKGYKNAALRASKDGLQAEKNVRKNVQYLIDKSASFLHGVFSLVQGGRAEYDSYSKELGIVALEMMKMDDPRKAKMLLQLYNNGTFKEFFKELEGTSLDPVNSVSSAPENPAPVTSENVHEVIDNLLERLKRLLKKMRIF